jgi:hypothetical protein
VGKYVAKPVEKPGLHSYLGWKHPGRSKKVSSDSSKEAKNKCNGIEIMIGEKSKSASSNLYERNHSSKVNEEEIR